jgi:hypothetical protein
MTSITEKVKTAVTGAGRAINFKPLEERLAAAREDLAAAQLAASNAALAAEEGEPGAQKRLDQALADRKAAEERVDRLEGALAADTARQVDAHARAVAKARTELVARRRVVLRELHDAAAEAEEKEDAYVAARVKVQRIIDESLPVLADGTKAAIRNSQSYVLPALFRKLHTAKLPYHGIQILLHSDTRFWRERLPGLDHAEAR